MKKLVIFAMLFTTTVLFAQKHKTVEVDVLNVRAGVGTDYEILEKLHQNDVVEILGEYDEWTKVQIEGGTVGFVYSEFLSSEFMNDTLDENNVSEKNKYSWLSTLLAIIVIGFLIIKFFDFFRGIFKPLSSINNKIENSMPTKAPMVNKSKEKPLHYYNCGKCNITLEADKRPNSLNCSRDTFHKWNDLGIVGDKIYSCKNCSTTIRTKSRPNSLNCSSGTFHKWTKLN